MNCVLVVSLSHLAWAVSDITRSPWWACWLLAVAFDLCLVLGELCHVAAEDAGVWLVTSVDDGGRLPAVDVPERVGVPAPPVRAATRQERTSPGCH
jgi:hypothetical protein